MTEGDVRTTPGGTAILTDQAGSFVHSHEDVSVISTPKELESFKVASPSPGGKDEVFDQSSLTNGSPTYLPIPNRGIHPSADIHQCLIDDTDADTRPHTYTACSEWRAGWAQVRVELHSLRAL